MAMGKFATDKVYDDLDEKTLDALPVTALHRNVDIPLAEAHKQGKCLCVVSAYELPR